MIGKHELQDMDRMIENGATVSEVNTKYPKYDYWEIYSSIGDYSLLGKKRCVSNRLKKLKGQISQSEKETLIDEVQELVDDIYEVSKKNGRKLIDIAKLIGK